jgi:NADH-quinone oxidoreductase subunit N
VDRGQFGVVAVAVLGAAAGFYYYLRPILAVYSSGESDNVKLTMSPLARVTAILLIAAIFVLGVYPAILQPVLK